MNDDRFEELLNQAGSEYNLPPAIPREEMWEAIVAESMPPAAGVVQIAPQAGRPSLQSARRPWLGWATAAAALLVLGVGIGRLSAPANPSVGGAPATLIATSAEPLRVVTREHLASAEALLSVVKTDARSGRVEEDVVAWGTRLLFETRLLMNSAGGQDVAVVELLKDLELILVQVVRLNGSGVGGGSENLRLIAEGMNDQRLMMRIRAMLPAAGI